MVAYKKAAAAAKKAEADYKAASQKFDKVYSDHRSTDRQKANASKAFKAASARGVVANSRMARINQLSSSGPRPVATSAYQDKLAAPVKPVTPPPASVERRPISDPVRIKAESSKMAEAFTKAPGARDNHVSLASLRATMPHLSKDEFVAVVNRGRDEGKYSLDSFEGRVRPMTAAEREAAIVEKGTPLVWISRRRS
jgi:hypothetical protein